MSSHTLNLNDHESAVLQQLADENDITKTHVLRMALRLYQVVHERAKRGEKLAFTDAAGRVVPVVVLNLP